MSERTEEERNAFVVETPGPDPLITFDWWVEADDFEEPSADDE